MECQQSLRRLTRTTVCVRYAWIESYRDGDTSVRPWVLSRVSGVRSSSSRQTAHNAAGSASLRFAVGEFRLERVPGGGGCDGGGGGGSSSARDKTASVGTKRSAAPSSCELQLLGDDACLCNEVEGQLEESELRLLVRLVSPAGQRVRLAGGHAGGAAEVVTEEGDLLLENSGPWVDARPCASCGVWLWLTSRVIEDTNEGRSTASLLRRRRSGSGSGLRSRDD